MLYHIQHVELKEKCFELWTQKKKDGAELEVDTLVSLMRSWYDNHNTALDRTTVKDGRVYMVTGESPPTCRVCGGKDHEKASCPLVLGNKKIFCKNHPGMDGSHTTAACMNPGGSNPSQRGRGTQGRSRGSRGNRGRSGRWSHNPSRERAKEEQINTVSQVPPKENTPKSLMRLVV